MKRPYPIQAFFSYFGKAIDFNPCADEEVSEIYGKRLRVLHRAFRNKREMKDDLRKIEKECGVSSEEAQLCVLSRKDISAKKVLKRHSEIDPGAVPQFV